MIPFYVYYTLKALYNNVLTNRAVAISKKILEIFFQSTYLLTYQIAYNLLSNKMILPLNFM